MDHAIHPHHVLTDGQLPETVALIRWDMEHVLARIEAEANSREIEAELAARKLGDQP